MSASLELSRSTRDRDSRDRRLALALSGGAALLLAAAGLLLWWREAEAVFAAVASAALAWCM